ncbi:uncharacterized protein LOC142644227 [Castanea sativa]|uniref:uncharacterized protein LOC142644227 n=1 Tax=Castanea sativa TaxID=21020 RepID=UPI003F64C0B4
MQQFRDVVDECGFLDLGFVGTCFTWSKDFDDGHSISKRLDRGLANNPWFMKFPGSFVHHLHCISSDNCPLLISLSRLDPPPCQRSFKFEEMWLSDERCVETVEASWSSHSHGPGDSQILKQIEKCGKDLAWWNHNVFGNVRKELERKKSLLVQAEQAAIVNGQNQRVRELKDEVNLLLVREARLWSQRSQVHPQEIALSLVNYYQSLFSTSNPDCVSLDHVPMVITDEMNIALTESFLQSEIREALKQMAPLKALGLDGMPPLFYQHFWGVVDSDVMSSILSWLNSDEETRQWNHEVIDGIFTQEEADLIKQLPLARMVSEDSLFWPFSWNGIYNSKSGYLFLKAEEDHGGTEANVEQEKAL